MRTDHMGSSLSLFPKALPALQPVVSPASSPSLLRRFAVVSRCAIAGLLVALGVSIPASATSYMLRDRVTGKSIPNRWFLMHDLPLLDPNVQLQDPDGDGFLNEDEWRHQTDPNDEHSHPAYYTKLFLLSQSGPRFVFKSHDTAPGDSEGKAATFQVNLQGARDKSHFVRLGDTIPATNYRVAKFVPKSAALPSGVVADVSELTLASLTTGEQLILPLGVPADGFEGAAILRDEIEPKSDFRVVTSHEFTLKAEPTVRYRLLALAKEGAVIILSNGSRYTAPLLPKALIAPPAQK
jgi:hypothetical protein